MELIKIKKGNKTLEVTEKAFRVVYQNQGYKVVSEITTENE